MIQELIKTLNKALASTRFSNPSQMILNELLERLSDLDLTPPTYESPIILTDDEINALVDMAVSTKIMILQNEQPIPLLTLLISMGTWQNTTNLRDNYDPYLGLKDRRIETCIAHAAMREIARRKEHPVACTKNSAIFGSSVNPPTENHLIFIKHLIENNHYVYVIPNAASPLKPITQYAPQQHRYEMIRRALEARPDIRHECYEISTIEIDRAPPSRMFMTLSALILLSDPTEAFSLILTLDDNFEKFNTWYLWHQFGALCPLKFYFRPGVSDVIPPEVMIAKFNQLLEHHIEISLVASESDTARVKEILGDITTQIHFIDEPALKTKAGSATKIREHFIEHKEGRPQNLPEVVYQYIMEHDLYHAQNPEAQMKCPL